MKPTAAEIEELRDASDKACADRDKAYAVRVKAIAAYEKAKESR